MFEQEQGEGRISYRPARAAQEDPRATPAADARPIVAHELDSPEMLNLFRTLMGHYRRELDIQHENRLEMQRDEEFYDGEQYTEQERKILEDRGQVPLVFNILATAVDWMLGTERRGRTDYRVLPRREEGGKSAERKSQLLKYVSDVNNTQFHVSRAFAKSIKAGLGWLECGVQSEDNGEPIYERFEDWRTILADSAADELDLSDARYMFRTKWADLDAAVKRFPDRKPILEKAAQSRIDALHSLDSSGDEPMDDREDALHEGTTWGIDHVRADRRRVRLIEGWIRMPEEGQFMRGGQFAGEIFDPQSPGHQREVATGRASVATRTRMRMYVVIFCDDGLLHVSRSPYRHNRFPFTPVWGKRRSRDGLPYGLVRSMRDPQSDLNKRASKALYILSTNKVIMDEGAVDDIDEFRDEAARPDAILTKKKGYQLELGVDRDLSTAHLELMSRSVEFLQMQSGITDENMGRTTNARTGKAIIARQDQGALATAQYFDNLRFARQIHGEKLLSLVEQFMTEEREFRITNMRGNPEYVKINTGQIQDDIVSTKADFVISEDDWKSSMRQAQVEQLLVMMQELGKASPEVIMATLDLIVETMDIPQREEIVKRIRQITGMDDPDADPNNPDPETQARQQAKQAEMELQRRAAEAEVAEKEAKAKQADAQAEKYIAERARVVAEVRRILAETSGTNVETQVRALEAAAQLMGSRGLEAAADTVLSEAGYQHQQIGDEPSAQARAQVPGPRDGGRGPGAAGMAASVTPEQAPSPPPMTPPDRPEGDQR